MEHTGLLEPPRSGRDIRRYRLGETMTIEQLAHKIGIAPQTLEKIERGESNLWMKSREKVVEYFQDLPEFDDHSITVLTIWPELMEDKAA